MQVSSVSRRGRRGFRFSANFCRTEGWDYFSSNSINIFMPVINRNLQILATEVFKVYINIAPPIFTEIFNKRNPNYQLRHTSHFSIPSVRSVYNGTESLSFLGPKIWDIVPTESKEVKTLSAFKSGIKNWWSQSWPCRLCKRYLANIGFI